MPTGTRDGRLRIGFWNGVRGARGMHVARDGAFAFASLPLALSYRVEVYAPGAGLAVADGLALAGGASEDAGTAAAEILWRDGGARVTGYVSGVEGFNPEDGDSLCGPARWPDGRYLQSAALDAIRALEVE